MKQPSIIPNYEKFWLDEMKAHKYTISKNQELREVNTKLLELNDRLLKAIGLLNSQKEFLEKQLGLNTQGGELDKR